MPVEPYVGQLEPADDSEIWCFMPLPFFEDLMANEELHFCRADLFTQDEMEGIPPEEYVRTFVNLRWQDGDNDNAFIDELGVLAQEREAFYVNCWHLAQDEKPEMWRGFAETGVAIISRYDLLKATLNGLLDRAYTGLVRYGEHHLTKTHRVNTFHYITTKRIGYKDECEVRGFLWCPDLLAGHNRHIDADNMPHKLPLRENDRHKWVLPYKRRRILLKNLITGVVVSPFASKVVHETVETFVKIMQPGCVIRRSTIPCQRKPE